MKWSAVALVCVTAGCASNVSPNDAAVTDAPVRDESIDALPPTDVTIVDAARPLEPAEGYLEAITDAPDAMPGASSVDAHFYSRVGMPPCREAPDGSCVLRLCDRGDGGYRYPAVSAGEITIADSTHQRLLTLPYRAMSSDYASGPLGNDYWPSGAHLDVRATGDVFGAFSVTLDFPARTALIGFMPEYDSRSVVVDRTRDMALQWTPIPRGHVTVTISVGTSDASARLECLFEGSLGAATITQSQLALLPITGPDAGSIDIAAVDETSLPIADASHTIQQVIHARAGYVLFASSAGTR